MARQTYQGDYIIHVYAPTNTTLDDDKNDFYNQLQLVIDSAPTHDMKIVMEDFDA